MILWDSSVLVAASLALKLTNVSSSALLLVAAEAKLLK